MSGFSAYNNFNVGWFFTLNTMVQKFVFKQNMIKTGNIGNFCTFGNNSFFVYYYN